MRNDPIDSEQPPGPPEIQRRLHFQRTQVIGIPLLLALPILALFGVFGESHHSVNAQSSGLMVVVEYPTRTRYQATSLLSVSVENTTRRAFPAVIVRFDRGYIDRFAEVRFTPQVKEVTDTDYVVELSDIPAGESRRAVAQVRADAYGRHRGYVTVAAEGVDPAQVPVSTMTFP